LKEDFFLKGILRLEDFRTLGIGDFKVLDFRTLDLKTLDLKIRAIEV
jgi:hypothetical protein